MASSWNCLRQWISGPYLKKKGENRVFKWWKRGWCALQKRSSGLKLVYSSKLPKFSHLGVYEVDFCMNLRMFYSCPSVAVKMAGRAWTNYATGLLMVWSLTFLYFLDDADALSIFPVWWTVFVQVWGICLSVSSCLLFVLQKSRRKVFVLTLKVAFSKECVTHPFELYVTVGTVTSVHRDARYLWCLCCIFSSSFFHVIAVTGAALLWALTF